MTTLTGRVLLALAVVAAVGVGALVIPAQVEAAPPCPYTSIKQTSTMSGFGFTCTEATNNLRSLVEAAADDDCQPFARVILASLVITEECHAHSETEVHVTGYLQYRCMLNCDI